MKYNYLEELKEDINNYLCDNYTDRALQEKLHNKDDFFEELHDDLWVDDSITGNASGSYTVNTYLAEQYICHNLDLLKEALDEFGDDYSKALERGAEFCDVTIRCYLLDQAIAQVLDEIEEEYEERGNDND